jgi:hypothetical protein
MTAVVFGRRQLWLCDWLWLVASTVIATLIVSAERPKTMPETGAASV